MELSHLAVDSTDRRNALGEPRGGHGHFGLLLSAVAGLDFRASPVELNDGRTFR